MGIFLENNFLPSNAAREIDASQENNSVCSVHSNDSRKPPQKKESAILSSTPQNVVEEGSHYQGSRRERDKDCSKLKSAQSIIRMNTSGNQLDSYEMGKIIGQGGFGTVCIVTHKASKLQRAMKIISKQKISQSEENLMFDELLILKSMDHPNIVKVLDYFQDPQFHYLISEFCSGGQLFERIQQMSPFTQKTAAYYMKQILSAISYCHNNKIAHRDIKPENILFDSESSLTTLKVIDFGASAQFSESGQLTKCIGTPFYVAPEILFKLPYDEKCDIWSLGVIMYILLCGYPPFFGDSDEEIYDNVMKGQFEFYDQDWQFISSQAQDLINQMLNVDPVKRITAAQAFAHSWVQSNTFIERLDDRMLKKLSGFQAQNKLRSAIMEMVASQVATHQDQDQINQFFSSLDKDGDGVLCREELLQGYEQILGDLTKAQVTVDELFNKLDTDGSGKIEYKEFLSAAFNREKYMTEEKIKSAFKLLDLDGNGQITKLEIEEMLGGMKMNENNWMDFLGDVDSNGDGMISLDEFVEMFLKKVDQEMNNMKNTGKQKQKQKQKKK